MIDISQWTHTIGVWNGVYRISTGIGCKRSSSNQLKLYLFLSLVSIVTYSSIVLLVQLLLLCGDIETNPGPPPPHAFEVLRSHIGRLIDSITNPVKLANDMFAHHLISEHTKNEVLTTSDSHYSKASKLVNTFHTHQKTLEPAKAKDNLITLCKIIGDTGITQIILQELGIENTCALFFEKAVEDSGEYITIMREKARDESILQSDWPPRMDLVDRKFYGRLSLLESKKRENRQATAQCQSRGELDKLPVAKSSDQLIGINDLFKSDDKGNVNIVVIDGPPGVGKTTLCRKIRQMWAQKQLSIDFRLVLLCNLRQREVIGAKSLSDLVQTTYKYDVSGLCEYFNKHHGEGLLYIFDGWDEFPEDSKQCSFVSDVISRNIFYRSQVIVTSRSYASEQLLTNDYSVKHVQVLGFSNDEIHAFINAALEKKHADRLIDELKLRSDICSICCIPVVCFMVIFIYSKNPEKRLPITMTEMYTRFIVYTIQREAVKQSNMSLCKRIKDIHHLPSPLNECLNELCSFSYDMLKDNVPHLMFDSQGLSRLALSQEHNFLGLMTSFQNYDDDCYQFIHLTIQEYLAALWMTKQDNCHELFNNCFHSPHFHMVLQFVAGHTKLNHTFYRNYFNKSFNGGCRVLPTPPFNQHVLSKLRLHKTDQFGDFKQPFHLNSDSYCLPFTIKFHTNFHNDPFHRLHYDHPPQKLLYLLYESQNTNLCEYYASCITDCSLCYNTMNGFTDFGLICLNYFISNASVNWSHIHLNSLVDLMMKNAAIVNMNETAKSSCERLTISLDSSSDFPLLFKNFLKPSSLFSCCKTIRLEYYPFHTALKSVLEAMTCIFDLPCIKNISLCFCHYHPSDSSDEQMKQYNYSLSTPLQIAQKIKNSKTLEIFQLYMDLDENRPAISSCSLSSFNTLQSVEYIYVEMMLKIIFSEGLKLSESIKAVTFCIMCKPNSSFFNITRFHEVIEQLTSNQKLKSIQLILPSDLIQLLRINKNNNLSALDIRCSNAPSYYSPFTTSPETSNISHILEIINSCKYLEYIQVVCSAECNNQLLNAFLNLNVIDLKFTCDATDSDLNNTLINFFLKIKNSPQHCKIQALKITIPRIINWKFSCGEALQQLLEDNKTLQCLELHFSIPTNCLHYLRAGLLRNNTLKELTFTIFFNIFEELSTVDDVFFRSSSVTKLIIYMDPFNTLESSAIFDLSSIPFCDLYMLFNIHACIDKVFTLYYLGVIPLTMSLLDQNQQMESLTILFNYPRLETSKYGRTRNADLCRKAEEMLNLFWRFIKHQPNLKYLSLNDNNDLLMKSSVQNYMINVLKEDPDYFNNIQEVIEQFPVVVFPNLPIGDELVL